MDLALEMTQPVHQQPRDLGHEIALGCLPLCLLHRDDDIAEDVRHLLGNHETLQAAGTASPCCAVVLSSAKDKTSVVRSWLR